MAPKLLSKNGWGFSSVFPKVFAVTVALMYVLMLPGCALGESGKVRSVIEEYNALLPAVYSRADPELVSGLVSDAEKNRILMYILYLKKSNELMDSRLLDLRIEEVTFDEEGRAFARVEESWEYRMLDAETREPKGEWMPIGYESEYTLERTDGSWVIVGLDVSETATSSADPQ